MERYRLRGKNINIDYRVTYKSLMSAKSTAYGIIAASKDNKREVRVEKMVRKGVWGDIGRIRRDDKGVICWTTIDRGMITGESRMLPDGTVVKPILNPLVNVTMTVPYRIAKQNYLYAESKYNTSVERKKRVCKDRPKSIKCKIAKGKCSNAYVKMKHAEKRLKKVEETDIPLW